ncbi:hypothetical protein BurJ1DRAFT_1537 [Burkholderiales bacterium JOSHI_001]|nr:hypothetical protein BurJ1DRAFT_1537 [Burkholderiales bacterium JOSHI_001]
MSQAALPLFDLPTAPALRLRRAPVSQRAPAPEDRCAFDIGWDHAHHGLTPPLAHLHPGHPVRTGWQAGQAAFGRRTLKATEGVRLWLALRLHAWTRGRVFEGFQVTPHFLSRIGVAHCPVTGERLHPRCGRPDDLSVDRLLDAAGYAAGNLVVMSARANRAKAALRWDDALQRALRLVRQGGGQIDGLGAGEWQRLAVLMSYVSPMPHAQAATLPMRVLPPPRLRVMNPVQALQAMLTLQFLRSGYTARMARIAGLLPAGEVRQAYQLFMNTLLARRLASGAVDGDTPALRQALEAAWAEPLLQQRWERLALRLNAADCERVLRQAAQRGLGRGEWRWLDAAAATEGWGLPSLS